MENDWRSPMLPNAVRMDADHLAACFNACFDRPDLPPEERAHMCAGSEEPLYRPWDEQYPYARIWYGSGLAASVLHEAAHWLYAGRRRRALEDYGYWYVPDGRDAAAQQRFEEHEWPVQAIECTLAVAADLRFRFSADNLASPEPSLRFKARVAAAVPAYIRAPSQRLATFRSCLLRASGLHEEGLLATAQTALAREGAPAQFV